jgi:PTS system mannose-specific IIC component
MLAFLTALGYFICIQINYGVGQCMTERPIVVGALIGVLLGDIKTGVTIGAALEVAFMGIVNIGGVTATDAATSTAVATAFAIYSGLSVEEAVAVAIPVGLVSNMIFSVVAQLASLGAPVLEKICKSGNEKQLYIYEFVMWLLVFGVKSIIVFVGVYAGADPITSMISSIPEVISNGLTVASGMLGAVGMSMLMRMLWSKEVAIYYFLGFILVNYLNLPTMGIAAIGVIIAIAVGLREKQIVDLEKKVSAGGAAVAKIAVGSAEEEEDFLS